MLCDTIQRALARLEPMPDFPANQIPKPEFNPGVHDAMEALIARRNATEAELVTLHDRDAAHPLPQYDDEYLRLSTQVHDTNRTLYAIFARYLDRPSRPYPEPEEPSAHMAMALPALQMTSRAHISTCPFLSHPLPQPPI